MQLRTLLAASAALALLAAPVVVQADTQPIANLSNVSGDVLVNQGDGFQPATPGLALHAGDRVIVSGTGQAGLFYSGGCGVSLAPGSMATVSSLTPCKVGLNQAGIVAGQPADAAPPAADPPPAGPFGLAPGWTALLLVGIVAVGAAGLSGAFESSSP
jgi:hypothetical protein